VAGATYNIYNATVATNNLIASGINTNAFYQTGLGQNTRSVVQVQAVVGGTLGPLSNAATAYSLAAAPVYSQNTCPSPTAYNGTGITTYSVTTSWLTVANGLGPEGNPTTYQVQYATGNWNRSTGNWNPGIVPSTWTILNTASQNSIAAMLQGINPGVQIYIRGRSLNTDGNFLNPVVNTNYGYTSEWIDLVSSTDPNGFTSTLPLAPTTISVGTPSGPTSTTLSWPTQAPNPALLGYPDTMFQVMQTTCVINSVPDFRQSSGPMCGIVPPGLGFTNLPFSSSTALVTNLATWSTYYFTLNEQNLPHWESDLPNQIDSFTFTVPAALYYTNLPGAAVGTLAVNVSAQYGGSISSAPVGMPGQQHTIWFNAPAAAFPSDTVITIATFSVLNDPRLAACPGAGGSGATLCGGDNNLAFEITANPPLQPTLPLYFTVAYNSGEPNIPGDSTVPDPLNAVLMRFDLTSCKCVPVLDPNTPNRNMITGELNHLSIYQVATTQAASSPEDMRIYPNPYYTSRDGWLTIDQIPAGSRIRLFTLRGEMVLDSNADSHGIFTWQGANRGGRAVASGVYLVVVEGNGIKTIRKLAVIR
jgi:hypothetical protein